MLALIDSDIVAYRCAAVNNETDANIARWQVDELMKRILDEVGTNDYVAYISGDHNFRYAVCPDYKANRRDMVRPKHLEECRIHLVREWDAKICDGIEADDAIGILASASKLNDFMICSIDKDLKQIPGLHYNFVKREFEEINQSVGIWNFFYQLLVGDATDNVKGCPGIGAAKAPRILKKNYYTECLSEYLHTYNNYKEAIQCLTMNAQLLWILRKPLPDGLWKPEPLELDQVF